jgi:hypothetical protein
MVLIPKLDTLCERDLQVGHKRVHDISWYLKDFCDAGFESFVRRLFVIKKLPKSMMPVHKPEIIRLMILLGAQWLVELTANLAVRTKIKTIFIQI